MSIELTKIEPLSRVTQASAWGTGKLILFGEHAVVYGYPALAVALPQGLKVTLAEHDDQSSSHSPSKKELTLAQSGIFQTLPEDEKKILGIALNQAVSWINSKGLSLTKNYTLEVKGALPFKVGLGSSAALSVATLKALAALHSHHWSNEELFEGAMMMEKVFHQNPSGIDHQVSIEGGAVYFKRESSGITFSKQVINQPLHLVLTWGPRNGTTADAVHLVRERLQVYPHLQQQVLRRIEDITHQGQVALEYGALETLGELLLSNHQELRHLGVVTTALNDACERFLELGALGAKMTGAGLGGTCFGLFATQEQAQKTAKILSEEQRPCWQITLPAST